ncbi:MAG: hypothetical protein PHP59_11545 [Methanofollis sp.]|uniref:hypothetical protein n=1 Tax=Methanofollis sp. TaxID=2052835 RepID=UPI00261996D9|nr:hypothetical protein [Methanofollis sp.]MDD4255994.1 hypothetical protein [Methanofollis sp.]
MEIKFTYGNAGLVLRAEVLRQTPQAYIVAIEKMANDCKREKVIKCIGRGTTDLVEYRVPFSRVIWCSNPKSQ